MIELIMATALFSEQVPCVSAPDIAYDGDTPTCMIDGKRERLRMFGVEAPEINKAVCKRRRCIDGDGIASRDMLRASIKAGAPTYRYRIKADGSPMLDPYQRKQVLFYSGGFNVACASLASGQLVHLPAYDKSGQVLAECAAIGDK
jgi:endonuclease YncB( thermonuclease family)